MKSAVEMYSFDSFNKRKTNCSQWRPSCYLHIFSCDLSWRKGYTSWTTPSFPVIGLLEIFQFALLTGLLANSTHRERINTKQIRVKNNLKQTLHPPAHARPLWVFILSEISRLSLYCHCPTELLEQRSLSSDAYQEQSAAFSTPLWPIIG